MGMLERENKRLSRAILVIFGLALVFYAVLLIKTATQLSQPVAGEVVLTGRFGPLELFSLGKRAVEGGQQASIHLLAGSVWYWLSWFVVAGLWYVWRRPQKSSLRLGL